jgi:hypothetical protein
LDVVKWAVGPEFVAAKRRRGIAEGQDNPRVLFLFVLAPWPIGPMPLAEDFPVDPSSRRSETFENDPTIGRAGPIGRPVDLRQVVGARTFESYDDGCV